MLSTITLVLPLPWYAVTSNGEPRCSKTIIPIHTEHEDHFDKLHNSVRKVNLNEAMEFTK